jgi:hypothetical protein
MGPSIKPHFARRVRAMSTSVHRIYYAGSRGGFLFIGLVFMLIGGFFVLSGLLSAIGVLTHDRGAAFFCGLPIGALMFYLGWKYMVGRPYILCLMNDGTLHAIRVVGRTIIRVDEIRTIDKDFMKIGLNEDDARQLHIWHKRGSIAVDYFPQINDFIAEVQAMNPTIEVRAG